MADPTTPQPRKSNAAIWLCILVIGYLGYRLHKEEQRTTPEPQRPLPTFESRIEPLREHASDWDAGYFFLVGNHENRQAQVQPAVYEPRPRAHPQQGVYDPSKPPPSGGNEILQDMQRQNDEWDRYMRSQRQQFDEW
jgi:hypothetical protein